MEYLTSAEGQVVITKEASDKIAELERVIEELQEQESKIKEELINTLKMANISKIQNDKLSIALLKGNTTLQFDKDKFREENKELYEQYITKQVVKKDSVRITLRKAHNNYEILNGDDPF